jgi:hypothetical protein
VTERRGDDRHVMSMREVDTAVREITGSTGIDVPMRR